jgi:hypothetical protein
MKSVRTWLVALAALALVSLSLISISCEGDRGPTGPQGEQGDAGPTGPQWEGGTVDGVVSFNANTSFNDTVDFSPGIVVNFCGAALKMCGSATTIDFTDATITGLSCSWEGGTVSAPASFDENVTFKDVVDFMEGSEIDFTGASVTGLLSEWAGGTVTAPATFSDDVVFENDVSFTSMSNVDFSEASVTGLTSEWDGGPVTNPAFFGSNVEFIGDVDFDDDIQINFTNAEIQGLNELNEYLNINDDVEIKGDFRILDALGNHTFRVSNRSDLILGGNGLNGDLFVKDSAGNNVCMLRYYGTLELDDPGSDTQIIMYDNGTRTIYLDTNDPCEILQDLRIGGDFDVDSDVDISGGLEVDGDAYFAANVGVGTDTPQRSLHVSEVMRLEPTDMPPLDPSMGDMYMDAIDSTLMVYDGAQWQACW